MQSKTIETEIQREAIAQAMKQFNSGQLAALARAVSAIATDSRYKGR